MVTVCCPVGALDVVVGLPPHPLTGSSNIAANSANKPRCSMRRRRKPNASSGIAKSDAKRKLELVIRAAEVVRVLTVIVVDCG